MKKTYLLLLLFISGFSNLMAVPAYPYPLEVRQPNGEVITIRMHGDEFFHYLTTEDGTVIMQEETGYYSYAKIQERGILASTGQNVSNSTLRSGLDVLKDNSELFRTEVLIPALEKSRRKFKPDPAKVSNRLKLRSSKTETNMRALVILVNFKDVKFTVANPNQSFFNMLNQPDYSANGGTGSAKDFYRDNSNGEFIPDFDVFGPVDLPQNMAFYGANVGNVAGNDVNPEQMVIDACKAADLLYPELDFSNYSNNTPNLVDNVYIFYAGYGENITGAPTNTIWPHKYTVYYKSPKTVLDGDTLADYACSAELRGKSGAVMSGIGTFTHEFGHVIGLPDLYDADGALNGKGVGLKDWSTMDSGPYLNDGNTPPNFSMVERWWLDWIDLVTLTPEATPENKTIYPLTSASGQGYQINTPTANDFYVAEVRKKEGWDAYLPGEGMLVYHVDVTNTFDLVYDSEPMSAYFLWLMGYTNVIRNHQCLDLIRANNNTATSAYAGNPFPGSTNVTSIPATKFNSWAGANLGTQFTNIIKNADGSVSFSLSKTGSTGIEDAATPAGNVVYVQGKYIYLNHASKTVQMEVYDVSGRKYAIKSVDADHPVYIAQPGIYIVRCTIDNQIVTDKVVVR